METELHRKLRELAEGHDLTAVPGLMLNSVRFEKPRLCIETTNYFDFTVVRGRTQKGCVGFTDLTNFLESAE